MNLTFTRTRTVLWTPALALGMAGLLLSLAVPTPTLADHEEEDDNGKKDDDDDKDLEKFAGTWVGVWERQDTRERGVASTRFIIEDGELTGWHYDPNMTMENVTISKDGKKVTFSHDYGVCRATHEFKIKNAKKRQATSTYTVSDCRDQSDPHEGHITYGEQE